jgi:hypothetical protein
VALGDVLAVGPVVLLDVLALTAAGGDRQGGRPERHGTTGGVDDQQFFLDPDGAHPLMIASSWIRRRKGGAGPPRSGQDQPFPVIPNNNGGPRRNLRFRHSPGSPFDAGLGSRNCCVAARRAACDDDGG